MNRNLLTVGLAALLASLLPSAVQAATAPTAGKVFKDCKNCPEMVVLPAGTFTMGTPDDEVGREPDEGPMHDVTFAKPFAMSRFQVTAGEWDSYVKESGVTSPTAIPAQVANASPASRATHRARASRRCA